MSVVLDQELVCAGLVSFGQDALPLNDIGPFGFVKLSLCAHKWT